MFALRRLVSTKLSARAKHTLPELPYGYEALEPIICRDIMQLHHEKHHQAYVTNLNVAEEKLRSAVEKCDITAAIAVQGALRFNGGGHLNHSIFWNCLSPCATQPNEMMCRVITREFCSVEKMKEELAAAAVGVQGSGWAWLGYNKKLKRLEIATCANQDPLEATKGLVPLFGIDVWEHAYYLQYKNVRADYVKAIFELMNWNYVAEQYSKASGTAC